MLVLRLHYPPKYVLDEMQMYEIRSVMDYEYYANKDSWEQTRLIAYLIAQVNSKKQLKQSDIMQFYWEKEETKRPTTNKADIERLKAKAQQYIKQNYK